jgi:ABC-type uncharacterized transport system substrate-binding protein
MRDPVAARRIAASLIVWASVGGASQAAQPKRILILRSSPAPIYEFAVKGFTKELSRRGVPCVLEDKVLPGQGNVPVFIDEVKAHPPDLTFTIGTLASRALMEKGGLPFVYSMVVDPASLGLAGGGTVMEVPPAVQLAFIRDNFPQLKRVGVIHSTKRNRELVRLFREYKGDRQVVMIQAETPEDMSRAIQKLPKLADCLLMVSDVVLYSPQTATQIILQTIQNNIPLFAVSPSFVKAGALAAVYPAYEDNGRLAAEAASRFFAGEDLSTMPVFWPAKPLWAVNLVISRRLSLPMSEQLVASADEVVR